MIYLLATVEIKPGELERFTEVLAEYVPIAEKHGMRLVASWRTVVGTVPEVTDVWAFQNLDHFEKARQAMAEDPERQRVYARAQSCIARETFKLVSALPFSPLQ